ncbi:hypothetical protein CMO91_03990 [Candidatus Woesearchaeota archaeon]|mgnify:CR=1 FL=1|jgi:hypothetical protein|nr:hypothetical protein [Candidatus Woesearchaeota archaeon]|tara:strand:- start:96 stop:563 length:468 start_codon:yes stop_codon:yes gene_type:complete
MNLLHILELVAEAVIILFIGFMLSRIGKALAYRVLHEAEVNRFAKHVGLEIERSFSIVTQYLLYVATIGVALHTVGVLTWVLAGLGVVVGLLAIGTIVLEAIEVIPNWRKRKPQLEGRQVTTRQASGKVVKVGIVETLIETKEGLVAVQNKFIRA